VPFPRSSVHRVLRILRDTSTPNRSTRKANTMSVTYTAVPIPARAIQDPEFERRGLHGLTAARLDQIHMIGIPTERQLAYAGYVSNIAAFLHATAIQSRVSCSSLWYPAKLTVEKIIPFKLPPLVVQPKIPGKREEDKEAFRQSLGVVVETIRGVNGEAYVIQNPTFGYIKTLPRTINVNTPSPPDATSYSGMLSFTTTLRIISLFLATHTYPAFMNSEASNASGAGDVEIHFPDPKEVIVGYRGFLETYVDAGKAEGIVIDTDVPFFNNTEANDDDRYSGQSAVLVAKPAPLRPTINVGAPSEVPALPGYVFPYFRGLVLPSKDFIITVMRQFFLGCFGDSSESAAKAWKEWVQGMDKWYRTEAGREIAHILFGIRLALESQSRLFLFQTSGGYLGFSLLGYKFVIWNDGQLEVPCDRHRVRSFSIGLDKHSEALAEIIRLLNDLELRGQNGVSEEITGPIRSTRQLFAEIARRDEISDDTTRQNFKNAVRQITFDEKLWAITLDKLILLIQMINDESIEIPSSWPMYLSPDLIYDQSRYHQLLACFGPMAPSLVDGGGQDFPIPKGIAAEDPASDIDPKTKKPKLPVILVTGKKLSVAIQDWQGVVKRRRIKQSIAERAAGHRTLKFSGKGRDDIWAALKLLKFTEEQQGKRKREADGDDDDEGPSKKTRSRDVPLDNIDASFFD